MHGKCRYQSSPGLCVRLGGGGWLLSPSLEMTPVPKVTVLSVDRSPVGCQVKGAEPGKVGKVGR